jgi:hypothetical protein
VEAAESNPRSASPRLTLVLAERVFESDQPRLGLGRGPVTDEWDADPFANGHDAVPSLLLSAVHFAPVVRMVLARVVTSWSLEQETQPAAIPRSFSWA